MVICFARAAIFITKVLLFIFSNDTIKIFLLIIFTIFVIGKAFTVI